MPSRPPKLHTRPRAKHQRTRWKHEGSRHERGYGLAHTRMRERVLIEEPLCRACMEQGLVARTTIADHIVPKAQGGTDDRENYQGLCKPCSDAKTAREAAAGRARGGGGSKV